IALESVLLENLFERRIAFIKQAKQQMFGADVIILEFGRLSLRSIERFLHARAEIDVTGGRALYFVPAGKFAFEIWFQLLRRNPDALQQIRNQAVLLADERKHQVFAIDLLMRKTVRDALRLVESLLGFNGQLVHLHTLNFN